MIRKKTGFTLVEILISLTVFGLVMAAASGAFYKIYNDWQRQRNYLQCIENARWAMERIGNELRQSGNVIIPPPAGDQMRFRIDPNADGNPPFRTIEYQRSGTVLERRWMQPGIPGGWQPWQELTNFVVANPSGNPIFDWDGTVLTIELTVRPYPGKLPTIPGNHDYTLRTQVRPRN